MPYQQPLKEFVHLAVNPTHAHFTHPAKTDAEYYLHLRVEVPSGNLPDYYPLQIISQIQFRRPHQEVENKEICSKHRMFELLPPTLAVKPTASVLKLIPHMPRSCSTTIMQHRYHVMPCPTSAIWFCIVGAFDKGLNRLSLQRWCIEKLLDITKECLASSIHGQCLHRLLLE